ncbi:MAG: hypothetical protein OEX05_12415, partial [Chloroflexota bacterium]|nr:hypothetical protein [Chloroflexota bacterium]
REARGEYWLGLEGKFKAKVARTLTVAARVGVPADATAVTGNLTVVNQTRAGYVSLTRTATNKPTTSTLNFPVRDIRANGVTSPIGPGGNVGLVYMAASGASTDLVLDISGYFRVVTETASSEAPSPSAGSTTGTGRSTEPEAWDLSRDPPR